MSETKTKTELILSELNDDNHNSELWEYSIDTESFLTETSCGEIEVEDLLKVAYPTRSDDGINSIVYSIENDTSGFPSNWADELPDNWNRHATENTCNCENDLSNDFVYTVVSPHDETEWYYNKNDVYIIVSILSGGDPRCCQNYSGCRVFVFTDSVAESGFLDWGFGWQLCDFETGDPIESEKYQIGYAPSPTGELDDYLDGTFYDSDSDTLYGLLDDKIVKLYPDSYYGEVARN